MRGQGWSKDEYDATGASLKDRGARGSVWRPHGTLRINRQVFASQDVNNLVGLAAQRVGDFHRRGAGARSLVPSSWGNHAQRLRWLIR